MIKQPNVAGTFYPGETDILRSTVVSLLGSVEEADSIAEMPLPKAIIAPHAGYIYSGPIAATIYSKVSNLKEHITKVVLVGPSHFVPFNGIAATSADSFMTPLGEMPVAKDLVSDSLSLQGVEVLDIAFEREHCLEVQLPFLQMILPKAQIVPFLAGNIAPQYVADLLKKLWGDDDTLIVISSDLSHYHDYNTARKLDHATTDAILHLQPEKILQGGACGRIPIQGLLLAARDFGLTARLLDLRNSGDTVGDKSRVVGYGAYQFA